MISKVKQFDVSNIYEALVMSYINCKYKMMNIH